MNPADIATNYRPVELKPPAGASPGLMATIADAQQKIRTAVQLWGVGAPSDVPGIDRSLGQHSPVDGTTDGVLGEEYRRRLSEVTTIEQDYEQQSTRARSVATAAVYLAHQTLDGIQHTVDQLNATFRATPPPSPGEQYLSTATERDVLAAVTWALDEIGTQVDRARAQFEQIAGHIVEPVPLSMSSGASRPAAPPKSQTSGQHPAYQTAALTNALSAAGSTPSSSVRPVHSSASPEPGRGSHARPSSPARAAPADARGLVRPEIEDAMTRALIALDIPEEHWENWKQGYRVLIERESGGNPHAINNWDSNAAKGTPTQGLTQLLPENFGHYRDHDLPDSINDPAANIAASMRYVMARHHVARDGHNLTTNVQQADADRPPMGY
ncbi:transglycosylase SLT domain-containing protein [Nocardia brasiliensis]|uniref:transglycosylase SLT domain-containing protein n=1 Tax=Nocardia brasiliensis TaxID=37326 RepID=UPI0024545EBA|nr:transglycosylase SLT domain-containing protein [Nocardia brasiliensis]